MLAAIIWGTAAPIIKFTLGGIDPLPFLAYRFSIAAVVSLVFFSIKIFKGKKFHYLKKNFKLVLIYGFLAVPLSLGVLFFGLDNTTVLDLSLIGAIAPLIVMLGGVLFFHDRITKKERAGILIVLLGVFINSFVPIFKNDGLRLSGNLLLIVYLLADSGSILFAKRAVKDKIKSSNLTNLAFLLGALVFVPLALVKFGFSGFLTLISDLPLKYHLGVWYMAVLSGTLAYFFYVRGQRSIETSEAALFNYLQPIFTIPLAVFWLKETVTASFVVGLIFITFGLFIAAFKGVRSQKFTE